MADEKEVVPPAIALRRVAVPPAAPVEGAPVAAKPVNLESLVGAAASAATVAQTVIPPVKKWKFVKNFGVADVLHFKDGSSFTFRQISRNTDFGVLPNSFVVTSDETLANNLREAAKNPYTGVVEVPA